MFLHTAGRSYQSILLIPEVNAVRTSSRLTSNFKFYVSLTVHLGIILLNSQLDAEFFFRISLLQISTCFEHSCAHHQEN
jgi:hypothetical protein